MFLETFILLNYLYSVVKHSLLDKKVFIMLNYFQVHLHIPSECCVYSKIK